MKLYSDAAKAALERGEAIVSAAVEVLCDPPFRVFGGYGVLPIDGHDYTGIGDRGLAQEVGQSVGGSAQGVQLTLSGIEQAVVAMIDAASVRAAPVTVRKLIFDSSGTQMLDASVYARGRVDQLPITDNAGGKSSVSAMVETAARGLGRRGGRMRTDADQRLIKSIDGSFKSVSYAAQKTLYWGGKRPASAASAVGGGAVDYSGLASLV